jgi:hypothetical protein
MASCCGRSSPLFATLVAIALGYPLAYVIAFARRAQEFPARPRDPAVFHDVSGAHVRLEDDPERRGACDAAQWLHFLT